MWYLCHLGGSSCPIEPNHKLATQTYGCISKKRTSYLSADPLKYCKAKISPQTYFRSP